METILLSDQAPNAGATDAPRKLGGLGAWVTTNQVDTAGGALTEDMLKEAVLEAFTAGGEPSMLLVSPANKQVVSTFSGIAEQRYQAPKASATTIIGAADIYLSDFNTLSCVPDRFLSDEVSYVLDPSMFAVSYLRPFKQTKLAKTGDSDKYMLNVEYSLQSNQEAASAVMRDLT